MRRLLDGVYRVCGALAAFCIFLIAALVLAQVGGRLAGVLVPGADDLAGYALTASSFLALAHTLRANGHIRLTLLIRRAGRGQRFLLESGCLAFGVLVTGYFAYHVIEMAWDAYRFGERSQGILSVPLWIPQAVMALGAGVLFTAFVDDLVAILRGGTASYERAAADPAVAPITREG
ncbi:MAG: TRAP transporter small permease [Candidatus Rokuibacteriota bacterium]